MKVQMSYAENLGNTVKYAMVGSLFLRIFLLTLQVSPFNIYGDSLWSHAPFYGFNQSYAVLKLLGRENDSLGLFDSKSQLDWSKFGYI